MADKDDEDDDDDDDEDSGPLQLTKVKYPILNKWNLIAAANRPWRKQPFHEPNGGRTDGTMDTWTAV